VNLRRATVQALVASLFLAALSTWWIIASASLTTYIVVAAILFIPIFGLRLIVDVGGELLEDERRKKRAAGMDDRWPWT
jgi:hypothetical protein